MKDAVKDNDVVLLVCNPMDAVTFVENDPNVLTSLVMTDAVDIGTVYLVKKDEFIDWLKGNCEIRKVEDEEEE